MLFPQYYNSGSAAGGFTLVHPDGAARKTSGVEIAHLTDALADQDGCKSSFTRLTAFDPGFHGRAGAVWQCFLQNAALQQTPEWDFQSQGVSNGLPDVGIAHRGFIDEVVLKLGPDRRHEVHGVGAAEAAMHALALLQYGIGNVHGAHYRLPAVGREGAEIDHDRRSRRARHALHIDRGERQRAGETPDIAVDEQPAYIVLRQARRRSPCQ